jgi:hypothetical protein
VRALRTLLLCLLAVMPITATAQTYLLMAEEQGCPWCARWDREVSGSYHKTPEGRAAPLRRFDVRNGTPDGVAFHSRIRFTPTFILVRDNKELGRIEGYPGEDFFWGLLGRLLDKANVPVNAAGKAS